MNLDDLDAWITREPRDDDEEERLMPACAKCGYDGVEACDCDRAEMERLAVDANRVLRAELRYLMLRIERTLTSTDANPLIRAQREACAEKVQAARAEASAAFARFEAEISE